MKNLFLFLLLTSLIFSTTSCNKEDLPEGLPDCIESEIKEYKKLSANVDCQKTYVKEYIFEEETVYVGYAGDACIESGETIYTEECEQLCFVSGLGGTVANCNGVNFYENATFVKLIWEGEE